VQSLCRTQKNVELRCFKERKDEDKHWPPEGNAGNQKCCTITNAVYWHTFIYSFCAPADKLIKLDSQAKAGAT
jgi:hypothetical protein